MVALRMPPQPHPAGVIGRTPATAFGLVSGGRLDFLPLLPVLSGWDEGQAT
jgi:hypothetical protein